MKILAKAVVATSILSSIVFAGNLQNASAGVVVGTLGAGVEGAYQIKDNINARLNISGYNYSKNGNYGTDIDFDGDFDLFGVGVLVDYYPFDSKFRLTAGGFYNGTEAKLTAKSSNGTYTINGKTYSTAAVGEIEGKAEYNKIAPYIGIGWGNALDKNGNWHFGFDIGAMYAKPDVSLSAENESAVPGLADDIRAEEENLQDDADKFKLYPYIALSLSYRF